MKSLILLFFKILPLGTYVVEDEEISNEALKSLM